MDRIGHEAWAILARGGHAYVAKVHGDALEIHRDRKLVGRGRWRDGRIDELETTVASAVTSDLCREIEQELRTSRRVR